MAFPDFFEQAPALTLRDPLAEFLGAADGGLMTYRFVDAVRLTGHACPTVAVAWLMGIRGLRALWPDSTPERGGVRVDFRRPREDGVTGVIANVIGLLTGAVDGAGFKGIGDAHDRRLASFAQAIPLEIRMTRLDSGYAVDIGSDLSRVAPAPDLPQRMHACITGHASAEDAAEFRRLWQDRVRRILCANADDVLQILPVHSS